MDYQNDFEMQELLGDDLYLEVLDGDICLEDALMVRKEYTITKKV